MNVIVAAEQRFARTPDGCVWTKTVNAYSFWRRYLKVFGGVTVVARVIDVAKVPPDCRRADGADVSFVGVPHYVGPWQYAARKWQVDRVASRVLRLVDAVILRIPGMIGTSLWSALRRTSRPYGVEVGGDPYEVFGPGVIRSPMRAGFRLWYPRILRRQCADACAAAYVTEYALQHRYPPGPRTFTTHYSSVDLDEIGFAHRPRPYQHTAGAVKGVTVASLEQMYKGVDVLIDAALCCVRRNLDLHLAILGDGRYRSELESRVKSMGLGERVRFLGAFPAGQAVAAQLDQADLFVLPSRVEGLPAAMIEAMARALPCIGTTVGGVPELLCPQDMVPPGDVGALAGKILEVAEDPARLARMSARNLSKATEYRAEVLNQRRRSFYSHVRDRTESWLREARRC